MRRRKWKQGWIDHYQSQGITLRPTLCGFEVAINSGWEFVPSDAIGSFSRGVQATLESIARKFDDIERAAHAQ